jgi:hypothetical protein
MHSVNSKICSYYTFLVHNAGLDARKAQTMCECLSIMSDEKKLNVLADIFSTGKSIFEKNKCYDKSLFLANPNEEDLIEMSRYSTYSEYLKTKVPLYMDYVLVVANIIKIGGYKGVIQTSFQGVNMITDRNDKVAIEEAMREGVKRMSQAMQSDIKVIDEHKDVHAMVSLTGVSIDKFEQSCAKNNIVNTVGIKDLRFSILSGSICPRDESETTTARIALLSKESKIPVFVAKVQQLNGKNVLGKRVSALFDASKLESMGFDYHKLASGGEKVITQSSKMGATKLEWNNDKYKETLLARSKVGDLKKDEILYLSSSWVDTNISEEMKKILTHCDLRYVGKGGKLWNWVAFYKLDQVRTFDEAIFFFRVIPKLYKIMVLVGLRRKPWVNDAKNFLTTILHSYNMLKAENIIWSMLGHMLDVETTFEINTQLKPSPGTSYEIMEKFFGDVVDGNNPGTYPQIYDEDQIDKILSSFKQEEQTGRAIVDRKDYRSDDAYIDALMSSVYVNDVYVLSTTLIDSLRTIKWDQDLFWFFLTYLCDMNYVESFWDQIDEILIYDIMIVFVTQRQLKYEMKMDVIGLVNNPVRFFDNGIYPFVILDKKDFGLYASLEDRNSKVKKQKGTVNEHNKNKTNVRQQENRNSVVKTNDSSNDNNSVMDMTEEEREMLRAGWT